MVVAQYAVNHTLMQQMHRIRWKTPWERDERKSSKNCNTLDAIPLAKFDIPTICLGCIWRPVVVDLRNTEGPVGIAKSVEWLTRSLKSHFTIRHPLPCIHPGHMRAMDTILAYSIYLAVFAVEFCMKPQGDHCIVTFYHVSCDTGRVSGSIEICRVDGVFRFGELSRYQRSSNEDESKEHN